MATIGFIGLGKMGLPMAANLQEAGHQIKAYDIVEANVQAAASRGMKAAASAAEAAVDTDAVFTMLPSGSDTLSVYGESAALSSARPGTLFVDSSTVDVASARRAHELAEDAGMVSLDAPVSGGVTGAIAGTLTFMAGGSNEAFERARPYLDIMGGRAVHCGDAGSGQAAKICNNMVLGISMIGVSEAFMLAEKLGLSKQALFDVASTSSGQCWSLTSYCPAPGLVKTSPANNDYKPGFSAALMLKDLKLSQEAAESVAAATPLGKHATNLYQTFNESGYADVDFSGIINFIREAQRE